MTSETVHRTRGEAPARKLARAADALRRRAERKAAREALRRIVTQYPRSAAR